jgi:hypothetical protein
LYAGALLCLDEGHLSEHFRDEVQDLADSILRRAKWPVHEKRWPSVEEILEAVGAKDDG